MEKTTARRALVLRGARVRIEAGGGEDDGTTTSTRALKAAGEDSGEG